MLPKGSLNCDLGLPPARARGVRWGCPSWDNPGSWNKGWVFINLLRFSLAGPRQDLDDLGDPVVRAKDHVSSRSD